MKPVQWYYARENKQYGPVPTAELKRLAQSGDLRREDLVWREGLKSWTTAKEVKGLFEEPGPATSPQPVTSPAAAPAAVPANGPSVSPGPTTLPRRQPLVLRHPIEMVLDAVRRQFTPPFVEATSRLFTLAGHYTLLAGMLMAIAVFVALGVKLQSWQQPLGGLGAVLLMGVLQYAAGRFCEAIDRLRRTGSYTIGSAALPDCFALLHMALGAIALIGETLMAIDLGDYRGIVGGLGLFVVCQFVAFAAVNFSWLSVTVQQATGPGQEAVGILAFLLKTFLSAVPVVFGVGVIWGTVGLLEAGYLLYNGQPAGAEARALQATVSILLFAFLPLVSYLVFLIGCLIIDLCRALLSLAEDSESGKQKAERAMGESGAGTRESGVRN